MGGFVFLVYLVRRDVRFYIVVFGVVIVGGGEVGRIFVLKYVFMDLIFCFFVSCYFEYK